jgi:crossover junction endodeoxyribonuclease RuvC
MIILGIDPGTATVGIGVIECNGEEVSTLYSGWIETSKDHSPEERLEQIHRQTEELIQEHKPDVVAIERLFFFINYRTAMAVAESIGVIKLAAKHEQTKILNFAPLEIKSVVAGNGKAKKEDMKKAVKKILGVKAQKNKKTHFDDLCDALAVAICCARKQNAVKADKPVYNKEKKNKKGYKGISKRRVDKVEKGEGGDK